MAQQTYDTMFDEGLSLAEADRAHWQPVVPELDDLLRLTAPLTSKSAGRLKKEAKAASRGAGEVKYQDYFRWRMWECDKEQQREFLSDWLHWPIEGRCNDQDAAATTVAKAQCTTILEDAGVPTIAVLAVIDPTGTAYADSRTLENADQLEDFLSHADLPLFAKPNALLGSFGAFAIDAFDGGRIVLSDGRSLTAEKMVSQFVAREPYVLQHRIGNHSDIARWSPALATMRTMNFMHGDGPSTPFAFLKIPCGDNVADNFWREGNLLAELDVATGEIVRVVRGGGHEQERFSEHPDTGDQLVGTRLPFWDEAMQLNRMTTEVFPTVRYSSLDIAFTDDGPVVVEVNSGGSFDLPQVASGRGMLIPEVKDFFMSCGVRFKN